MNLRRHRFGVFTVGVATFCLANLGLLVSPWGSSITTVRLDDLSEVIAPVIAAAACLWTAWRGEGRIRLAWAFIGMSALSWALGQTAWSFQELVLGGKALDLFPSWPDLGYLAAIPLGIVGLLCFPATAGGWNQRLRSLLDGVLIGASLLFISWVLVLGPIYDSSINGPGDLKARIIGLAYPVGDVAMATILMVALGRVKAGQRLPYILLGVGVLCNTVADSAFAYLTTVQSFSSTNPVDAGWTTGYLLIALAAMRAQGSKTRVADEEVHQTRLDVAIPYIPVLIAGTFAIVKQMHDHGLDAFTIWDGLVVVLVVVVRQFVTMNDNMSLNQDLETRVDERTAELFEGRAKLHASESRFRSLVQNSSDIITIIDRAFHIEYLSASIEHVLGYTSDDLLGAHVSELFHRDDRAEFLALLGEVISMDDPVLSFEGRMRSRDGLWKFTETRVTSLLTNPSVHGVVLNTRDISEHKRLEQQLTHQAFHDALTGLPNRVLLKDRLEHEISRQQRRNRKSLGVLIIDIDGFKAINDSLGQAFGDRLLRLVSDRLVEVVRPGDTVACMGGDEFAVLLEDLKEDAEAGRVSQRILDSLATPFLVDGRETFVNVCIGIALPLKGSEGPDELLSYADLAMYKAKERGKGNYTFFQPELQSAVVNRLDLEGSMQTALERHEFILHYQPVIALFTGRVVGFEALIRWIHPERGFMPPLDFIAIAEQTGLIVDIGRWVMRTACEQVSVWRNTIPGGGDLTMAVNLSVRQLRDPRLIADVRSSLSEAHLGAPALTLEVTESVLMEDVHDAIVRLGDIRALGVRVALDDFGTGYSSFSYLRQIPLDVIKIDRSFVMEIDSDPASTALARSIVNLGDTLDLGIVAEGIEEPEQLAQLIALGCGEGQGYYFSKPLPADAIPAVVARLNHVMAVKTA